MVACMGYLQCRLVAARLKGCRSCLSCQSTRWSAGWSKGGGTCGGAQGTCGVVFAVVVVVVMELVGYAVVCFAVSVGRCKSPCCVFVAELN